MHPLVARMPRLRGWLIQSMIWLIRRKFALTPIYVEENEEWIELRLQGVVFTETPEGVIFTLRCGATRTWTIAPSNFAPSPTTLNRVWKLDLRTIKFSDGQWRSISPTASPDA